MNYQNALSLEVLPMRFLPVAPYYKKMLLIIRLHKNKLENVFVFVLTAPRSTNMEEQQLTGHKGSHPIQLPMTSNTTDLSSTTGGFSRNST